MSNTNSQVSAAAFVLEIIGVSLAYLFLYYLNGWFFTSFGFAAGISWIYLPAAIRLIAVLIFEWRGVVGLFLGTFITCLPVFGFTNVDTYAFPILSALGPMLAVLLGAYLMQTKADLGGLKAWQLFVFGLLGAAFNSVPHNLYFQLAGKEDSWLTGLEPMFVGDLAGTLIVLYASSLLLRRLTSPSKI